MQFITNALLRGKAWIFVSLLLLTAMGTMAQRTPQTQKRPNIILILADDMGYSDIGCMGSEISTPNLDLLAADGLLYTRFYNTPRCSPSRASLLTGLYPHQTGMGWLADKNFHKPGYEGTLNDQCVTIAQVLKGAGYSTYMSGKWHVTNYATANGPKDNWPLQRGFDKFYGIIKGGGNYYDEATLCRGNELISPTMDPQYHPKAFYFTNAVSDNAVKFIDEHTDSNPFFMYVAYTTPHWPMQAPPAAIQQYAKQYDAGWEVTREARYERMKALGILGPDAQLSPSDAPSWDGIKNKQAMARRMETYAAMITIMDQGIGEIMNELKRKHEFDNTIILFLSDNGGNAEVEGAGPSKPIVDTAGLIPIKKGAVQYDIWTPYTRSGQVVMGGLDVMAGPANSFVSYLKGWANVSNTPYRKYKHWANEGGISTPLIVHWPGGIKSKGVIRPQVEQLIDIMPTLVELAGATYPKNYKGHAILPMEGLSMVPTFENKRAPQRPLFWEHETHRAVRLGHWKILSTGPLTTPWKLYDLNTDGIEETDLSAEHPVVVQQMKEMWMKWALRCEVFPSPYKPLQDIDVDSLKRSYEN